MAVEEVLELRSEWGSSRQKESMGRACRARRELDVSENQ